MQLRWIKIQLRVHIEFKSPEAYCDAVDGLMMQGLMLMSGGGYNPKQKRLDVVGTSRIEATDEALEAFKKQVLVATAKLGWNVSAMAISDMDWQSFKAGVALPDGSVYMPEAPEGYGNPKIIGGDAEGFRGTQPE